MKGIINIGNSCYLNSAIQLLFNSSDFINMLNTSNDSKKQICATTKIRDNIKEYNNKTNTSFNPREIKSIIDKRTNQFNGSSQQDSTEFIIFLFDIIDKDMHEKLYNYFGIETTINIKCKLTCCLHETVRIENELLLYLPITDDLSKSYREYKSVEKLTNDYKCDKCSTKIISRRKIETSKWPNNLLIVLRRFNNMMIKNNTNINIPFDWRHNYKLSGGIVHIGNFNGGHYIYYGYNTVINKWFIANDNNISIVNDVNHFIKNIISQSYILYYVKN